MQCLLDPLMHFLRKSFFHAFENFMISTMFILFTSEIKELHLEHFHKKFNKIF